MNHYRGWPMVLNVVQGSPERKLNLCMSTESWQMWVLLSQHLTHSKFFKNIFAFRVYSFLKLIQRLNLQLYLTFMQFKVQWNFSKPDLHKTGPPWILADFFKSVPNNSLQRKSHKTGHPSKPARFCGPSAGWFREVSLYLNYICNWYTKNVCSWITNRQHRVCFLAKVKARIL
jgi:hypothetical protein